MDYKDMNTTDLTLHLEKALKKMDEDIVHTIEEEITLDEENSLKAIAMFGKELKIFSTIKNNSSNEKRIDTAKPEITGLALLTPLKNGKLLVKDAELVNLVGVNSFKECNNEQSISKNSIAIAEDETLVQLDVFGYEVTSPKPLKLIVSKIHNSYNCSNIDAIKSIIEKMILRLL